MGGKEMKECEEPDMEIVMLKDGDVITLSVYTNWTGTANTQGDYDL